MDRVGPYLIEDELGDGAMGTVYRVRHEELGAHYALKVLKPQLFQAIDGLRFKREMEAMAAVSGVPGVVAIHTAGVDDGRPYYVMDLVEGEDLRSLLRREGVLELERAVTFGLELARTLAELHARGLIHRDVKPANVIIDEADKPRLADFGLSKAFADEASRLTATGEAIGTPLYMAPEQARGEEVGPPTDVYALGMLLFVLVAGVPAVSGQTSVEILINANSGSHERLRSLAPRAPVALDELCHACFQPDPALRPSAFEVSQQLESFLASQAGGEAQPEPRRTRAGALIALAVVLGGGGIAAGVALSSRGDPVGQASDEGGVADWYASALPQLARGPGVESALTREWEARRAEVTTGSALWIRMELLGGELALRRGDRAAARRALEAARAVPRGSETRAALRESVWLEAGLVVAEGDPAGRARSLLDQAVKLWAKRGLPPRADLAIAQVRLFVRQKRHAAALDAIAASAPGVIPAELRCEVFLLAGRLAEAIELLPDVQERSLRRQVRLQQMASALRKGDAVEALMCVRTGGLASAPEGKQRLKRALASLPRGFFEWEGKQEAQVFEGMRQEVAYHELETAVEASYRVPEERVTALTKNVYNALSVAENQDVLVFLSGWIRLRPDMLHTYELFGQTLDRRMGNLRGHPERLEVLRRGRARTRAAFEGPKRSSHVNVREQAKATYGNLTCWLGNGLSLLGRAKELRRLRAEVEAEGTPDRVRASVANALGAYLLRQPGSEQEAEELIRGAVRLATTSIEIRYSLFYLQWRRGDNAAARTTARGMHRDWRRKSNRKRRAQRYSHAMTWLSHEAEKAGDLEEAASAALAVCSISRWHIGWPVRYALLRLEVRPRLSDALIDSAVRGVLTTFRDPLNTRLVPPTGLLGLRRRRAKLSAALLELAQTYPVRVVLGHPADF